MSVAGLLNTTCTIRRKTQTQSSATGAISNSWANVATGVACSLNEGGQYESLNAGRENGQVTAVFYFAYGQDVNNGDRIVFGSRTFEVTGPPIDGAGRLVYAKIPVREVKGGPMT